MDYEEKLEFLRSYIPFLQKVIHHLQVDIGPGNEGTLCRLKKLCNTLQDPLVKPQLATLQRCEDLLKKLHEKFKHLDDKNNNAWKLYKTSAKKLEADTNNFEHHNYQLLEMSKVSKQLKDGSTSEETLNLPKPFTSTNQVEELIWGTLEGYSARSEPKVNISDAPNTRSNTRHCISHLPEIYKDFEQQQNNTILEEQVNLPSTSKCMTQEHTINEICQEDCSTDGEFLVDVLDKMSVKIGFKKINYHMPEMCKISKGLQNYKNSLNLGNMSSASRCITQEEEISTISGNDCRANTESKLNILNTLNCKGDLKNYNSHLLKMFEDSIQSEDEVCTEEQIKRTAEEDSVEYRSSSESTSNLNLPLAFECMLKEKEVTVDVSVSDVRESSESKLSVSESQKNDLTTTNLEKYRKVPLSFISSVVEELEKKEASIPASGVNIFSISNTDNNLIVESSISPCSTKNDDKVSKNKECTENENNVKLNVVINCAVSECITDKKPESGGPETDQTDGACLYEEGDLDVFLNEGIDSVNNSKNSAKATRPNDFYITSKEPVEHDINKQKLSSENEGNTIPVDLRCNINKCDVESFHTDNIFVKNHDCVNKVGVNKENNTDSFNSCNRRSTTNFISERYNIFSGNISVGNLASISSCDKESMGESASRGITKEKRTMLSGTRTNFGDISTKNVKSILNQISQASHCELGLSYQTLGEVLTNENLTFEGYENSKHGCNKVRNNEKMLLDNPINKNVSGSLDIEEISQNDYSDYFAGKLIKECNEENKINEIADSSGLISGNSSGCLVIPPSSSQDDGSNDQLLSSHMGEGESSNQIVSKRANRNVAEETCQLSEMYEGVQKSSHFKNRNLCDQKKKKNTHKVLREDGMLVRDNRNYQKSFEKKEHCQDLSRDKITSENIQKIVMKPVSVVISRLLSLEKYVKNNMKSNQNSQNERIRNNENSFDKLHEGNVATLSKDLTYACTLCTFTTTDEKVFANHVKEHPISMLTSWCKKCQRVFPNVGKLVHHIQTSCTGSFDACIKCGVALCNFETKSPLQFYHHNRFKHRGYLRLNCNTCDKFFSMPHCLTLHVQDECLKLEEVCKQPKEETKDEEITSHQRNEQDLMAKAINMYKGNSDDPECISSQMLNSDTSSQKILQNPSDSIYLANCFDNQNLGKLIILKKLSPDKDSVFAAGEECQMKNLISHTLTQVQVTAKNTCEVENHATEMNNKSSKQATCKKGASPEDEINNASTAMVRFSEYWKGISTAKDKSTDESKKLIINSESKKCKDQTECCKEQSYKHKKDSSESRNATMLVDDPYSQDDSSKIITKLTAQTTHNKNQDFPLLLAYLRTEWFSKDPDFSNMTDVLTFSKKMEDGQSPESDHPILDMQVEVGKEPTVSKNTSTIQGFPDLPESKELSLALSAEEENFKYLCRDFEYEANLFSSALSREKPKVATNNDELMEHAVPTFVFVGDKQYENKTNSKPAEFSCISTNNPIRNASEDLEESRIEYKHLEEDVVEYEGKCAMELGVSSGNTCVNALSGVVGNTSLILPKSYLETPIKVTEVMENKSLHFKTCKMLETGSVILPYLTATGICKKGPNKKKKLSAVCLSSDVKLQEVGGYCSANLSSKHDSNCQKLEAFSAKYSTQVLDKLELSAEAMDHQQEENIDCNIGLTSLKASYSTKKREFPMLLSLVLGNVTTLWPTDKTLFTTVPDKISSALSNLSLSVKSAFFCKPHYIIESDSDILQQRKLGNDPIKMLNTSPAPEMLTINIINEKHKQWITFMSLLKCESLICKLLENEHIIKFFKCTSQNCAFTTDNPKKYEEHLRNHEDKTLPCPYCFAFLNLTVLTEHMLKQHWKLRYQCGYCWYRGWGKMHVRIHTKCAHVEKPLKILVGIELKGEEPQENIPDYLEVTKSYYCNIGTCTFSTFDPSVFKEHCDTTHKTVSVFSCYYCKAEVLSFERLLKHLIFHGINSFQCAFCLHGTETQAKVVEHVTAVHPDKPLQFYVRGSHVLLKTYTPCLPMSIDPSKPITLPILLGNQSLQSGLFETSKLEHVTNLKFPLSPNKKDISTSDIVIFDPLLQRERESNKSLKPITVKGELNRNNIEITYKGFIPVMSKVSLDKTEPVKLAPQESSIKNNSVEATPCFYSLNYLKILDNLKYITDTSRKIKKEKRKISDQNILDSSLQKFVVCKVKKLSEDQKPQFFENSSAKVKPKEIDLIHENKDFCRNEPKTSWRTSAKETVCISELGEITPKSAVQEISNQFKMHSFPLQSLNNSLNCLGTQVNFTNGEKSEVTREGVEVLISCVSEISSENEEDEVWKNKWSKLSGSKVQKDVQVNSDLGLNKSFSYYSFMEQKVDCVDVSSATNTEASQKDNPLEKSVTNECLIPDKSALNTTVSGVSTEDVVFKYKRLSDKTLNGIGGAQSNKEELNLEKGMKCIYKCRLCSVEMVTHRHILQHLQNVHCVQLHKCGYCDRTSKSSKTLIHHCKKYHERTPKTVLMYEKIIVTRKESSDSLTEVKSSTSFIENNIEETVQNDGKKEESFEVKTKMGKTNDLQLINGPVDNTDSFLKCKMNSLSATDQHLDREVNKVEHQAVFSKQQKSQTEGNVSLNNLLDSRRENNLFGNTDQRDWVRESKQSYNTKVCENPLEFLSNNDFQKVSQNQFLFSTNKDNEKSITSVATSYSTKSHNLAFVKQKFNAPKDKSFLFICPFCGYSKASYCDLKLHLFRELKYHRLLCLVCNMSCFGRKEIKAHFQRHHPGEELYYEHKCDDNTEQLVENFLRTQEILTEKNKMLLLSNTQILKETKKHSKTSLFDKKCILLCMYEKAVALLGESSVMNFKKDQEVPNPEKNIDNFTEAKIKNPEDKGKESIVNTVSKRTIEEDTNPLLSEELKKSGNKVIKFCHEEIKSKNNFAFSLFCAKHDKTEVQDEFLNTAKESSGISNPLLLDFEKESVQSFNHKLENNSVITKKQHNGVDDTNQSIVNTNTSLLSNSDEEKSKKDPLLFICPFCDYAKASYCEQKLHIFRELKYHRLLCVHCNVSCFGKREMKAHFRRYHPGEELYYERKCDRNIEELVERFLRNQENLTAKNKMLLNHEQMQRATKQCSDISVLEKKCKLFFICENVKTTKSPPIYFTDDYSDIKMQERKEISNTETKKGKNATNESKLYVIGDTNNGQKGKLKESTHLFPKENLKLESTPCLSEVIKYKYEEIHFSKAVESNIKIQNSSPMTEKSSKKKEESNQCDNSLNRTLQKLSSIDKKKCEASPVLFSCPFCNYTCSSYCTQKQHVYRELKYCRFFCLLCKTKFFNIKGLKAHFQKCHFGQKLCYEQKCDAETEEWVDHLLKKQKKLSVKGSKYLSIQANHSLNLQTSKKQYKYTCLFCGARKCSTGNFKKHLFNHKQYRPVKCLHCNKKFRYTCEVKQHLERHHPGLASYSTITKSDSIEDWVNEIISSQQLSNHHVIEQELHLDQTNLEDGLSGARMKKHSIGAFTCHWQNCSFVTDDKKKLKYHLLIHFSRTSFSCPFCQTLFDSEAKLKSHCELSHSEKSLPTASIKNGKSLSYGMKKNQLGNNSKTINCSYCGLLVYSDEELKIHICWEHQNESKEDIVEENNVASASQPHDKVLECESCGIKFVKRDEMLQHLKSHEKVLKSTDSSSFVNFSLYNKDQNSRFVKTMGSKNETNPSLNVSCEVSYKIPAVNNGELHLVLDELSSKDTISRNVTRCAYCRKNVPSDTIKQHCRKQHPNFPVKIIKHRPKTPVQLPKFCEYSCEKSNSENLKEDLLLNFVEHKSGENFYLSEKEPYRCEYCPAHFSCVTHLQKHWQVEHQKKLNLAFNTGMHDTKQENSNICNAVNQLSQQLNSKILERKSVVLHCASQLNDFAETFSQENYYPYETEPTSSSKRQIPQENTNTSCDSLSQGEFSFYGKKQKMDTSNIKVHIPSLGANVPYQSVTHLCNLQPCVLLTDLKSQLFTLGLS